MSEQPNETCMANLCDGTPGNLDPDYCDEHFEQILDELDGMEP